MTTVLAELSSKSGETGDVVGGAAGVGAGSVRVEVLVEVVDEVGLGTVKVGDGSKGGVRTVRDGGQSVGVVATWKEDRVGSGASLANGSDSGLNGGGPGADDKVVWLVHDTKGNLVVVGVLGSELRPEGAELGVGWATLADDLAVPAGVVVDINDTKGSTRIQAASDETVVVGKVGRVKSSTKHVVDEVLPADWETESVKLGVLDEVVHLGGASSSDIVSAADGAGTVGTTAKVETSYESS